MGRGREQAAARRDGRDCCSAWGGRAGRGGGGADGAAARRGTAMRATWAYRKLVMQRGSMKILGIKVDVTCGRALCEASANARAGGTWQRYLRDGASTMLDFPAMARGSARSHLRISRTTMTTIRTIYGMHCTHCYKHCLYCNLKDSLL